MKPLNECVTVKTNNILHIVNFVTKIYFYLFIIY